MVLKLNGGLGTGMGLDQPKSLLVVKDSLSFLDFSAMQVAHMRVTNPNIKFMLMNSFSTSEASMGFLAERYRDKEFICMKEQVIYNI